MKLRLHVAYPASLAMETGIAGETGDIDLVDVPRVGDHVVVAPSDPTKFTGYDRLVVIVEVVTWHVLGLEPAEGIAVSLRTRMLHSERSGEPR